jgi:16S rRNA (guanine527-N7)-methyltransferase
MFHVKHEGWEAARSLGVALDAPKVARLERFERSVLVDAMPRGMVAGGDRARFRERHVLDCLRAAPHLPDSGTVCDLGSGAGLPGLVLAIVRPDLTFVLVEVRRNRADFLRAASGDLENVSVHGRRLETLEEQVDASTARAFAGPARSWEAASRILRPNGSLIYWAGASFDPSEVPEGVTASAFRTTALAGSGLLVIMARQ